MSSLATPEIRSEMYLIDAVVQWMVESSKSEDTDQAYLNAIRHWIRFTLSYEMPDQKLTLCRHCRTTDVEVRQYILDLKSQNYSERTIWSRLSVLRSWFRWLHDNELMDRIPITKRILKMIQIDKNGIRKGTGFRHSLSLMEAKKISAWVQTKECSSVAGLSIMLQMVAGLRSKEVANLKLNNVIEVCDSPELENNVFEYFLVIQGKRNKTRKIKLESIVAASLIRYLKESRRSIHSSGPLLRKKGGGFYSPRSIQRFAKMAAEYIGREKEISSHDLRRTAATLAYKNGATLESLQHHLGHSSPTTTMDCYVNTIPELNAETGV